MDITLTEFLSSHGEDLAASLEARLSPVYSPENSEEASRYAARLDALARPLYPVQAEIAKGMAKALYESERVRLFLCGEQGCGKTTIGLAIAALAPRPQRVLVVCPTHLVEKWKREARMVLPHAHIVDLAVRNVIGLLDECRTRRRKPEQTEIHVISKERLKLSYPWKPAAWARGKHRSPHCGACGHRAANKDHVLSWKDLENKRQACYYCSEPLWQADGKLKRVAPAEYMKKRLKGFFDLAIFDEAHELKAGDSLQGRAMASVLAAAPRSLCLTGTLNGGYADDLFYLLFRVGPSRLKRDGFEHADVKQWTERYGVIETVTDLNDGDDFKFGRGRKKHSMIRKRPGVSPEVIGQYLLDKTAFLRLADVADGLPPYDESVRCIDMDSQSGQAGAYHHLEQQLKSVIKDGGRRALGSMLQALLSYPDSCAAFPEAVKICNQEGDIIDAIEAPRIILPDGALLPKEQALLDIAAEEKAGGRKTLVYTIFTQSRDIRPRLRGILERAGHRVGVLDASVEPKKRESWIAKHENDLDVLLVNPELVKTGLDLYAFPSVVFYQIGYNIFTLRQAARRSWRIGQTRPVSVTFLAYNGTMQAVALALIAKKLETALLVEGDLPEGLAEYGASSASIVEELGKALLDNRHVLGAEAAWTALRRQESISRQALRSGQLDSLAARPLGPVARRTIKISLPAGMRHQNAESILDASLDELNALAAKHGPLQCALF